MSSVVVFVFLLENLAGFNNALNETLINSPRYSENNITPVIQNCDPGTTDQILSAVSQDLDLVIVPSFKYDYNQPNDEDQSSENMYNIVLDNSLRDAENLQNDFYDPELDVFDNDFSTFYRRYDNGDQENVRQVDEVKKNETKLEFPKNASFLVAIFESLSNVTAQTCAGTLLSPRWVLTAANCVNILSNLYANNTNITYSSHYTVVAGSTNPLLDGSAHNVTSVLFHPDFNSSAPTHKNANMDGPYLALMRIEPEVDAPAVELMADGASSGDVMVYGWILSKNETDHDSLNGTSMSALILSSDECQALYNYKDNDVICLFNNDMDKNITQLSSGGPVLMVHDKKVKMLAVVQTDDHLFVAYPLVRDFSWISHIINSK